jgi:hypothetical protein
MYYDKAYSITSNLLSSYVIFYFAYLLDYKTFNSSNIFSTLLLMNFMRTYCVLNISLGINFYYEFSIILDRVREILDLEETKAEYITKMTQKDIDEKIVISY